MGGMTEVDHHHEFVNDQCACGVLDVGVVPKISEWEHAWRCSCGHLNYGKFGCGENEDGRYDVCERCSFEIYDIHSLTALLKVTALYFLVPTTEPWRE